MSSKLFLSLSIFAICTTLPACSSVSDGLPVVKLERKKNQTISAQSASYISPSPIGSGPSVQQAEAAIVCENDNMRARAADTNRKNDSARVLILEDHENSSSQVVGDIVVNCREYFDNKAAGIIPANYGASAYAAPTPPPPPQTVQIVEPRPIFIPQAPIQSAAQPRIERAATAPTLRQTDISQRTGLFYSVKSGDSLYRIAVNHCTSVEAIAQLNNINDPASIDAHDILRMPVGDCN